MCPLEHTVMGISCNKKYNMADEINLIFFGELNRTQWDVILSATKGSSQGLYFNPSCADTPTKKILLRSVGHMTAEELVHLRFAHTQISRLAKWGNKATTYENEEDLMTWDLIDMGKEHTTIGGLCA